MHFNDPLNIFPVILGGIFLLMVFCGLYTVVSRYLGWKIRLFLLKYCLYPLFFGRRSRLWVALQVIYWSGTIMCDFVATHALKEVANRAANLAVINLIPLIINGRPALIADILGISITTYIEIYRTAGAMTLVQAAIHIGISIHENGWHPQTGLQTSGLSIASGITVCILSILSWKLLAQIMSSLYFAASLLILLALWRHSQNVYLTRIYVLVDSLLFAAVTVFRLIRFLIRNFGKSRIATRCKVSLIPGASAFLLTIPINRPFRVTPGSYLYLWIPGASFLSGLLSRPYHIAWWETDGEGNLETVTCIVESRSKFTRRLAGYSDSRLLVWIDGPYGLEMDFEKYEQALLIATGIGIAAQMSYLRLLVETSLPGKRCRDIFVAWEIKHPSDLDYVHQWMSQLLSRDKGVYNLHFGIYVPSTVDVARDAVPVNWGSQHGRIFKIQGQINAEKVVPERFWESDGRSLITISAHRALRSTLSNIVASRMNKVIDIVELPFQPVRFQQYAQHSNEVKSSIHSA